MEAREKRATFSEVRWARSVRPRRRQLPQGPSVCDKIAASSDCSRPVNDYVHIEAADLCRPNARFTQERQGYQVLTLFGKLGYSQHFPYTASRTFDNLSYRCRLTPFDLCGRDGLQGPFSREDQITFKYHVEGDLEEPVTHIGWRGRENTLSVETVHTYPHEEQGVRSKSTFEISCRSVGLRGLPAARLFPTVNNTGSPHLRLAFG